MSAQPQNASNTHDIFFDFITEKKLNELYHRADGGNSSYLANQINSRLQNIRCKIKLGKVGNYYCDIFLNYYDLSNVKIGHISLHMSPKYTNPSNPTFKSNRFHIINNQGKSKHTIRFNQNSKNMISLSLNTNVDPNKIFFNAKNVTMEILNDYFDQNSPEYLGIPKTSAQGVHKCMSPVKIRLKSLLKTTAKQQYNKRMKTQKKRR
jgi:hypothetical protein